MDLKNLHVIDIATNSLTSNFHVIYLICNEFGDVSYNPDVTSELLRIGYMEPCAKDPKDIMNIEVPHVLMFH